MRVVRGLRLGLLAAALSMALVACSGDDGEDSAPTTQPSTTAGTPETTTATTVVAPPTTIAPVVSSTTAPVAPDTKPFVSTRYKVEMQIPADWPEPDESRGAQPPYFLLVGAADGGGQSLSDVCQTSASHHLRPYGSTPTVTDVSIGGQPGCVIEPSDDQPAEMRGMGQVIVRYSTPIELDSGQYGLFVLNARVPEIRAIADTLTFTA